MEAYVDAFALSRGGIYVFRKAFACSQCSASLLLIHVSIHI